MEVQFLLGVQDNDGVMARVLGGDDQPMGDSPTCATDGEAKHSEVVSCPTSSFRRASVLQTRGAWSIATVGYWGHAGESTFGPNSGDWTLPSIYLTAYRCSYPYKEKKMADMLTVDRATLQLFQYNTKLLVEEQERFWKEYQAENDPEKKNKLVQYHIHDARNIAWKLNAWDEKLTLQSKQDKPS